MSNISRISRRLPPPRQRGIMLQAVMLLVFCAGSAHGASPAEAPKAATVRVICSSPAAPAEYGSGVLAGSGDLVVTAHSLAECGDGSELSVIAGGQRLSAGILWRSAAKGLLLLRLPARRMEAVPPAAGGEPPADPQTVYAVGYPAAPGEGRDEASPTLVMRSLNVFRTQVDGLRAYRIEGGGAGISPGTPLFTETGMLAGICLPRTGAGTDVENFAIRIEEIFPELDRLGIPLRAAEAPPVAAPDWVAPPLPASPQARSGATPPAREGLSAPLIVTTMLIAVIAVVCIVRLIPHVRRRAGMPRDGGARGECRLATAPAGTRPVLYGISGVFAGSEFRLGTEPVVIGRDPQVCQLVFPVGEEGVGRVHCSIRYDFESKQFILRDELSINGTFLQTGERLIPEVECRLVHGMRFHLVSQRQLFEVRLV